MHTTRKYLRIGGLSKSVRIPSGPSDIFVRFTTGAKPPVQTTPLFLPILAVPLIERRDKPPIFLRRLFLQSQKLRHLLGRLDHQLFHFSVSDPRQLGILQQLRGLTSVKLFDETISKCKAGDGICLFPLRPAILRLRVSLVSGLSRCETICAPLVGLIRIWGQVNLAISAGGNSLSIKQEAQDHIEGLLGHLFGQITPQALFGELAIMLSDAFFNDSNFLTRILQDALGRTFRFHFLSLVGNVLERCANGNALLW